LIFVSIFWWNLLPSISLFIIYFGIWQLIDVLFYTHLGLMIVEDEMVDVFMIDDIG